MTAVASRSVGRGGPGPALLGGIQPVARLLAAVPIAVVVVLSLDVVSAAVAAGLTLVLSPLTGIGLRRFWRVTAIAWLAAPLGAVSILLYGQASGAVWLDWGVVHVTEGSARLALATLLRVLALALPSIVLFAGVDPTDLADGLGQIVRLPARFVLGALAGLRMLALFGEDWRAIDRARRARGVGDRRGPLRIAGQSFSLLVLALRRGSALATAMEARGFPAPGRRVWAREARFGVREWALLGVGMLVAGAALAAALAAGTWRFIGG